MSKPALRTEKGFSETQAGKTSYLTMLNDIIDESVFNGHIENFGGLCMIPIGIAGPLVINGEKAQGEFKIPMATTEGALVASYNRGLKAGRMVGGFWARVLDESVQRCPFFKFSNFREAINFIEWVARQEEVLKTVSASGSRYARLISIKSSLEGNEVILSLNYTTGDASGQNMVTICAQKVYDFILQYSPVKPQRSYIEANASGDKKTGSQSLHRTRGKRVVAEVVLTEMVVKNVLKTTPERLAEYWQTSTMAQVKTGSIGNQGHIANGLTAMFMATGQDVACITEAAMGVNRMEVDRKGQLYASLTLSNLIVGTVGGGTGLPTQRECLEMMKSYGAGNANKLAEIMASVALAGELSIASAIAEGHFTEAHQKMGR
ncbi:MAG: hydroxymethylglutaryl-CoA reductase [Owenweeksia sp.]